MEETKNTRAIILNNRPFKENDSLIDVYTKDFGGINLVARGTKNLKSKMRGHIEPLTHVHLMIIKGKKWDYLGAVVTENSFLKIRDDFEKTLLAGKVVKLYLENVEKDIAEESYYSLLLSFFIFLNKNKFIECNIFYFFFMLKFLHIQGFSPELENYLDTGKKIIAGKHFFDCKQGGVVENKKDINSLPVSAECIKILRLVMLMNFDELLKLKISEKQTIELEKIINYFFNYCLKY